MMGLSKKVIDNHIKQEWRTEKDVLCSLPFYSEEMAKAFHDGMVQYICHMRFRKKGNKNPIPTSPFDLPKINGCYGVNQLKGKDASNKTLRDMCAKNAITVLLEHAKDNYGFNWEDFEVWNINTHKFEAVRGVA